MSAVVTSAFCAGPAIKRGTTLADNLRDDPSASQKMMAELDPNVATALLEKLIEALAERLAPRMAELIDDDRSRISPWLTTAEAIEYSRLPEGTFRKLSASGKIPSHGGRTKLFYRPEIDQALLGFRGLAEDERVLRHVR